MGSARPSRPAGRDHADELNLAVAAGIDPDRLWSRLMALAEIGANPAGGVDRQALTDGEIAAWRLVIGWGREAGLAPSCDAAGNLFLTLAGRDRDAAPVLAGSHLDTQPTGGKFDGALGVLAALETATVLEAAGTPPARDFVVVAWMNEEGCRFAPGMMGSEAFAGVRPIEEIRAFLDGAGTSVGEALDRFHAAFADLPRRPLGFPLAASVELHIEQGSTLEAESCPIGIVTGIQGKKTFRVVIDGQEGHAGTLPPSRRRDAVAAFARVATALHAAIGDAGDERMRFTIGRVAVEPNAPSVVPSRVTFSIDLRHPENAVLDATELRIGQICAREAPPCGLILTSLVDAPSNAFDGRLRAMIAASAASRNLAAMPILSAAGHDSRYMAGLAPSAMIFIPCRDGISHAESEWAEPAHVSGGASVLLDVVTRLAFDPVA